MAYATSPSKNDQRQVRAIFVLCAQTAALVACSEPARAPVEVAIPEPTPVDVVAERPQMLAHDADATTLLGRWEGLGKQNSGPTWKMVLTIESLAAGRCATIEYPSIPCGGHWECAQPSDGLVLQGVERITDGRGQCHDNVPVMVRLARDRQSLDFAVEAGADSAEANLTRATR